MDDNSTPNNTISRRISHRVKSFLWKATGCHLAEDMSQRELDEEIQGMVGASLGLWRAGGSRERALIELGLLEDYSEPEEKPKPSMHASIAKGSSPKGPGNC